MKPIRLFPSLPVPDHFKPEKVNEVWRVAYQDIANAAQSWRKMHLIPPAIDDHVKIAFVGIDIQNTFCIPGFELFVGGRSGTGAVDDNVRLCKFLYKNLARITNISVTLDTHAASQVFHPLFFVDENGNHPNPYTDISNDDIRGRKWKINANILKNLNTEQSYIAEYLQYYTHRLESSGRYSLTVWPYHAILGGIGHALVASVEEVIFFHTIARYSQVKIIQKGSNPLTEHYSAVQPEIINDHNQQVIGQKDDFIINLLQTSDILILTGQAKSHCLAFTISDIVSSLMKTNPDLIEKIYILEDCTSPVVVPGGFDFTEQTDVLYKQFSDMGIHLVQSTDPIEEWPNVSKLSG